MLLFIFKHRSRIDPFSLPCCGSENPSHHFWVQKRGFRPVHRHTAPVSEDGEEMPMTGPAPSMSTFYRPPPISWTVDTAMVNAASAAVASTPSEANPIVSYASPVSPPVRVENTTRCPEKAESTYIRMSSTIQARPLPAIPSSSTATVNDVCYSTVRANDETPHYTNMPPAVLRVTQKSPALSFQQQLEQHILLRNKRQGHEVTPCSSQGPTEEEEPSEEEEKHSYERLFR